MKKLSFIAAFLLLVAMQNASAQRLISDTVLARYSASQLTTYFSDNQIPLSSSTGITCYRLIYETENAQGTDSTYASGLLIVPDVQNCPLPIAMYDHGTTLQRTDVPSYLNYEAIVAVSYTHLGCGKVVWG